MAKKAVKNTIEMTVKPPVVTVMGHVDHGKTSLLDAIRQTNVTGGESGGITQHIGAYQVEHNGHPITFIDTPGHAAFTQMRARGAKVTNIVILVVAADDGVMPQTKEAIAHAKAAGAPMIVAMNKIDAQGAQPERVKDELAREEVLVEGYGGDVPIVETSATLKQGIKELLEMVLLVAELQELKPELNVPAEAVVIESHQDSKRGPLATLLVQKGVLKVGDVIISDAGVGKIKAMMNDKGEAIRQALPATPVEVLGLREVPTVGNLVEVIPSEKEALAVARQRQDEQVRSADAAEAAKVTDLSELFANTGLTRELKLVLKADTQGSLEAIVESVKAIETEDGDAPRFIYTGTGNVSESDVLLASTSGSLLLAFRVKIDPAAHNAINQEKLMVQEYEIIYQLLEDIEDVLAGGIPVKEVPIKGRAEVLQTFELPSGDVVAGCKITDGIMRKGWNIKITRGDEVLVEEAQISEIRHGRDKVNESKKGTECGILIKPVFEFRMGDVIEAL
jgi:translation initiation factor IF-2